MASEFRGLVEMLRVLATQTPSSPFFPEPITRKPSTASENCAASPSFLIFVSWVILTLVPGFPPLPLSVSVIVAVSTLAMVPRYPAARTLGGLFVSGGVGLGCATDGQAASIVAARKIAESFVSVFICFAPVM